MDSIRFFFTAVKKMIWIYLCNKPITCLSRDDDFVTALFVFYQQLFYLYCASWDLMNRQVDGEQKQLNHSSLQSAVLLVIVIDDRADLFYRAL